MRLGLASVGACGAREAPPVAPAPSTAPVIVASPTALEGEVEGEAPAEVAPEPPPPPLAVIVPDYLNAAVRQRFDRRAIVVAPATASRRVDDPPGERARIDGAGAFEVVVVDEVGPRVRFVDASSYDLQVALWIDRAGLAERIGDAVALAPAPGQTPQAGQAAAIALGGAAPTIDEVQGAWRRVTIAEDGVEARGWIPAAAIDRVYRAPRSIDAITFDLEVRSDAAVEVVDAPDGRVLASILAVDRPLLRARGPARRGFRAVEVHSAHLEVHGLVRAAAVKTVKPGGHVAGGVIGGAWGRTHTNWIEVPASTLLFDAAGGEPFAVTTGATAFAARSTRRGAWLEVEAMTRWGLLPGWIVCPAFRQAAVGGARFVCTAADDPARVDLPVW